MGRVGAMLLPLVAVLAALSLVRSSEGGKLRVLALHGFKGNGADFCRSLYSWDKSILNLVDFNCLNAPFKMGDKSYSWSDPNKSSFDQGIAHVLDYIRNTGPYDGIIGFSQGGIITGTLGGIIEKQIVVLGRKVSMSRRPRFVIVHEGGVWDGLNQKVFTSPLRMKSFHVVGNYDQIRPYGIQLASKYSNPVLKYLNMPHGHLTPQYMDENFKSSLRNFLYSV